MVKNNIDNHVATVQAGNAANVAATQNAAWDQAKQPGVLSTAGIDPQTWAALSAADRLKVATFLTKKAGGEDPPENPALYYQLTQMAANDPDKFSKLNMMEYAGQMPNAEWKKFTDQQVKLSGNIDEQTALKKVDVVAKDLMFQAGLTDNAKATDAQKQQVVDFHNTLWRQIDAYQTQNNKHPDGQEIRNMAIDSLRQVTLPSTGMNSWGYNPAKHPGEVPPQGNPMHAFQVPPGTPIENINEVIPPNDRANIIKSLQNTWQQTTEVNIQGAYGHFRKRSPQQVQQ
jgi:hypothetical protein